MTVMEMSESSPAIMTEIMKIEKKLEEIEKKLEELIEDNERYGIMKLSEESLWEFLESEPDIYTENDVRVKLR
jgi:regulator of replication initiation timing